MTQESETQAFEWFLHNFRINNGGCHPTPYEAWKARGEHDKAKLLSDEMVELAGRGYMKSGKDMGCYSEEAMKAALEAVVGEL